jgi:hypothetical protein
MILSLAPISATYPQPRAEIEATNPGYVAWNAARPTLTGGYAAGRVAGECAATES